MGASYTAIFPELIKRGVRKVSNASSAQGTVAGRGKLWGPDSATDLLLNKTVPFSIIVHHYKVTTVLLYTACRFALLSVTMDHVQVNITTRKKGAAVFPS